MQLLGSLNKSWDPRHISIAVSDRMVAWIYSSMNPFGNLIDADES